MKCGSLIRCRVAPMSRLAELPERYRSAAAVAEVGLPSATLDQLRVGGIAQIGDSGIQSGIEKGAIDHPVWLGFDGFTGDRQRESFHGGSERAVLQYSTAHYGLWREEFPASAAKFVPGGFGENLVVTGMDESVMCIGDVVTVGEAVLQVAESRQPCFKLNHRFQQPTMARRVQQSGRTGWLYRVIEPGYVAAGDVITVIERPLPEWSVLNLQHYLYSEIDNIDMAAYLADLPYLSVAQRKLLQTRVDNAGAVEDWAGRLSNGAIGSSGLQWVEARIARIRDESGPVKSFRLDRLDGESWPDLPAGGHVKIKVDNTLTRSYSLTSIRAASGVNIAIHRAPTSEGGSSYMHENAAVGDTIMVSMPQNSFPVARDGGRHVMLASGIGVTPFLSMIEQFEDSGEDWELHYCARSPDTAAFGDQLVEKHPARVNMHFTHDDSANRLDLRQLLLDAGDKNVYCCGSVSFLESVREATAHWPKGQVHFESFVPLGGKGRDKSFTARLESTGVTVEVPSGSTLLAALRAAGMTVDSSCETGTCGTCVLKYVSGCVDHRDMVLSEAERHESVIACVSRASGELVIDI